jgi:hypothetical protein
MKNSASVVGSGHCPKSAAMMATHGITTSNANRRLNLKRLFMPAFYPPAASLPE